MPRILISPTKLKVGSDTHKLMAYKKMQRPRLPIPHLRLRYDWQLSTRRRRTTSLFDKRWHQTDLQFSVRRRVLVTFERVGLPLRGQIELLSLIRRPHSQRQQRLGHHRHRRAADPKTKHHAGVNQYTGIDAGACTADREFHSPPCVEPGMVL